MMENMSRERYPFRLNALHTRMALSELAKRFPIDQKQAPIGLELLFQVLGRLGLDEAVTYGEMLEPKEIDLLAAFFDRTQKTKTLLAIALILSSRKDDRALGPLLRWLHYLPPGAEVNYLRQVWNARGFRELFAGEQVWLHDLMAGKRPHLVDHFVEEISQGRMRLRDLQLADSDEITPLFQQLEMAIFSRGGIGITQIPAARAHHLARYYFEQGRDDVVRNYFINCPETKWPINLVKLIYQKKGAPDGKREPFYAGFPKGVMWGLRRQLFKTIIGEGELDGRRTQFWNRYLHHCQDVYWQGQVIVMDIHPMRIFEKTKQTDVLMGTTDPQKITIALDGMWERDMIDLLNDYIPWGRAH